MTIAPLNPEDRARWTDLWGQYLAFYRTTLPPDVFDQTWSRILEGREIAALAARDGDTIVGIVHFLFHPTAWSTHPTCYLQDLFTDPACRGRGIARSLIQAVAARAAERRCARLYWLTQTDNDVARALYDKIATHTGFIRYEYAL